MNTVHSLRISIATLSIAALTFPLAVSLSAADASIHNQQLTVTVRSSDGSYEITSQGSDHPVIKASVAAEINRAWVKSSDFPQHQISQSDFQDVLGRGREIKVVSSGLAGKPDITCAVRVYEEHPYGSIEVEIQNKTGKTIDVQSIRSVEAIGDRPINLGDNESSDRILSDSFSEDWPPFQIYDLGKAPHGLHLGVGSQLIYNPDSKQSLFFGALTSDRLLTILHLKVQGAASGQPQIASYTADSTGTTEIQATDEESDLRDAPAENRVELSLPVAPGASINSEQLMFAAGSDYHAQLENYGAAICVLHHARVDGDNLLGWWSWTAFYYNITGGEALTNAQWLAQHLEALGYDYLHIDEGYEFARGEYATPDATRFPGGMLDLEHRICRLGLQPGIWTAPFEVTDRTWVYQNHKDWLVHNANGQPIPVGEVGEGIPDRLFVLDTTNPGAQQYLRDTYRTLVRDWGIRYIKLDFMDTTAIEGYYHRPHTTALEAQRIGIEVIRKTVGDGVLIDKDGSPMLNVVGLVDEGRVSQDTGHSFDRSKEAAPGIFARYYMHRNFFVNDPDAFTISKQVLEERPNPRALTLNEAEVSITLAAVSGGMYEIGDDLPTLGSSPERVALAENPDLLQMAKLGKAAVPLDLMTYSPEDEQPSLALLREDKRQSMLAMFNWTDHPRSHTLTLAQLNLPGGRSYRLTDAFDPNRAIALQANTLQIEDQPAHSVRLIKILDDSVAATAPTIEVWVPGTAKVGAEVRFTVETAKDSVPSIGTHWDFGDGTGAQGRAVSHAYTHEGAFVLRLKVDGVDGIPVEKKFSLVVAGTAKMSPPLRYKDPARD